MGSYRSEPAHSRLANHRQADVVVVGAGIFGAAIAIALARQNRSVFLLERSLKEPNRIVGEVLQPGGVRALETLGLGDCLESIDSVPIKGYKFYYQEQPVTVLYPTTNTADHIGLPKTFEGRSFHHGRLIRRLRESAAREANITLVETSVNELILDKNSSQVIGVKSLTKGEPDNFFAPLSIVADGYKSKFRTESSRAVESSSKFWALELQDAVLPSPGLGHVLLDSCSPILLYPIGTRETRVMINVPEGLEDTKPANGGVLNYIKLRVLPKVPASLQPAFTVSLEKGRLRCMPNSFLPAALNRTPGLIVAGDALNMRHPLTGGGMTVALNDVVLLSELLHPSRTPDFEDVTEVIQRLNDFHWLRKRHTFVINILAEALYSIFAADDYYSAVLRRGCVEYFKRGGIYTDGLAGLLGGIDKKPLALLYYFFAITSLSIWTLLLSEPIWKLPMTLVDSIVVLLRACWVILPHITFELAG